jgi:putative endonuclease
MLETVSKKKKKWYYTGYTNNLYRRLEEHKTGKGARFCRGRKEIKLKYFETFRERSEAMRRELEIKSLSRKEKIKLIKNFNDIDLIDA